MCREGTVERLTLKLVCVHLFEYTSSTTTRSAHLGFFAWLSEESRTLLGGTAWKFQNV